MVAENRRQDGTVMAYKQSAPPKYVDPYLQNLNPNEVHNAGGDCINAKCDYAFTSLDKQLISQFDGDFTCPKCDQSYNYYFDNNLDPDINPGGFTHSGLTMKAMGNIGEQIIVHLNGLPGIGTVSWHAPDYTSPLDFIIDKYGCEVKTNHSESTPRFKLGGAQERNAKIEMAKQLGVIPSLIGVRLNFYSDLADIFFRPQLTDTWIGNPQLQHVAKVNFAEFNPYRSPDQVPPPQDLPDDDTTPAKNNSEDEFPF
jgi:hypothetical protein